MLSVIYGASLYVYDVDSFYLLKDRYIITIIYETYLFMNLSCAGTDF